ncbi:serine threonine-protein kinase sck1 [Ophiostoma piceae UAMH 11346]|uniref:Serine threonine-protein kinase sck1 n=1 Tax=Ophiostoma piceae (strain UAMH 11346) TaxID=1262450 RepID=S3C422_OPHP1|nr:serine threonine-protein kinase sck1 [Ophiostoma piceae UAMH 11346]
MSPTNGIDQPSRSSAADEDGTDQIGSDTPRSGIATPQPDLHDKRLPGIMSYFQVRAASFKNLLSLSSSSTTPSRPPSASSNASSTAMLPPNSAISSTTSSPLVSSTNLAAAAAAASTAADQSVTRATPSSEQPLLHRAAPASESLVLVSQTSPQSTAAPMSTSIAKPSPLAPSKQAHAGASTSSTSSSSSKKIVLAESNHLSSNPSQPSQPSPLSQMVPASSTFGVDSPPFLPHEFAGQQPAPRSQQMPPSQSPEALQAAPTPHTSHTNDEPHDEPHNTNSGAASPLVTSPIEDTPSASGPEAAGRSSLHPYPTPPASIRGATGSGSASGSRNDSGSGSGHTAADAGKESEKISVKKKFRKGWGGDNIGAGAGAGAGASAGGATERDRWNAPWSFSHKKSVSDVADVRSRPDSPSNTPLAGVVTPSSVLARHFSIPSIPPITLPPPSASSASTPTSLLSPTLNPVGGGLKASTAPDTPVRSDSPAAEASGSHSATAIANALANTAASSFSRSASADHLRKLTPMSLTKKSGHSTPTRSMSTAHSTTATPRMSVATPSDNYGAGQATPSGNSRSRAASVTPTPQGAQAPVPKGRLTIKISEARGLRRTRDPYVVAVFQRSELISSGSRPSEEDNEAIAPGVAIGSIAIQRQASDSGRPMAIPMRSRQSSNTSINDFSSFRNRPGRRSLTSPKWDAEAIFDVVDSNMLVDVSVYDHTPAGEEFLGHVDFQANNSEKDGAVRGWFPLRGHADTMAENTPTDESALEDNMRGRNSYNNQYDDYDEDMHDAAYLSAHGGRGQKDNEWDDHDARNDAHMGGVRANNADEPMFGGSHMDI